LLSITQQPFLSLFSHFLIGYSTTLVSVLSKVSNTKSSLLLRDVIFVKSPLRILFCLSVLIAFLIAATVVFAFILSASFLDAANLGIECYRTWFQHYGPRKHQFNASRSNK